MKLRTGRVDAPIIARDTAPLQIAGRIEDVEIRAPNRARIVLTPSMSDRINASVLALRLSLTKRIEKAIPGPDGAISAALISGTRGGIPDEDTDAYRDSGLALRSPGCIWPWRDSESSSCFALCSRCGRGSP